MRDTVQIVLIVPGKTSLDYFDPQEMAKLEQSIRTCGVLQAILVRPIRNSGGYEIVAGERRWRAARNVLGDYYAMPVHILNVGDIDADAIAFIENLYSDNPSVTEEAKSAQRLLYRNKGDKGETARQLGWHPSLLERRLALLTRTPAVLMSTRVC
jgi:ParB/RepB/Spo0J family partition protein